MKQLKTILITGASKGIGLSIVKSLLEDKNTEYRMILIARDSDIYRKVIDELKMNYTNEIIALNCDLGNSSEVDETIENIINLGFKIDILVNNAGYTNPESFLDVKIDDFRHTLEVNVISPFKIIQKLFESANHVENIINLGSTSGVSARPGWLTYAASKASLISMSDTLREELHVFGTNVICISPGRCATDLRKTLAPDEDPSTIMQPENVADIVKFLISKKGSYLTSHNLVIRQ